MTIHPVPKPLKRVRVKKCLKARKVPKAFAARRIPEYQEFIRGYACLLSESRVASCPIAAIAATDCAHVKSRGAGRHIACFVLLGANEPERAT